MTYTIHNESQNHKDETPVLKYLTGDKVTWIVLIFCAFLLLVAGYITITGYFLNRDEEILKLQEQGQKLATTLDHELKVQTVTLEMLAAEAQSVINGEKLPRLGTVKDLIPFESLTPDLKGYTLALPAGKSQNQFGSLTGLGEIPAPGTGLAKEVDMALSLSPSFEQVVNNNTALPWVYYTSAKNFIYIFPHIPVDEFFYSDILHETEFYTIANPQNNPERKLVWSNPYIDQAGAGLMVTVSKPVYDGDEFLGVLSIDTLTEYLRWILESNTTRLVTPHLVTADGTKIVALGESEVALDVSSLTPETIVSVNDRALMVFPLEEVEWYIVLEVDKAHLSSQAAGASFNEMLVFLFIVFSIVAILVIYNNMRSARYLAVHDSLTGLLNRHSFDELTVTGMQRLAENNIFVGAAIIDIDFFKNYNDYYGHMAGDQTLRQVADALTRCSRNLTDRLYRIGGEEFLLVLMLKSPDDLSPILERLIQEVNALNIPHDRSQFGHVTISIGAMIGRLDSIHSLEEANIQADHALYLAKDFGRNRWVISDKLQEFEDSPISQ